MLENREIYGKEMKNLDCKKVQNSLIDPDIVAVPNFTSNLLEILSN